AGTVNITAYNFAIRAQIEQHAIERDSNKSRQHQHEHRQDFQEAAENGCRLSMAFICGRKHTLHDHLIDTPIPNAEDGRAEKDSSPGKIRVAHRLDHMEVAGRYPSA